MKILLTHLLLTCCTFLITQTALAQDPEPVKTEKALLCHPNNTVSDPDYLYLYFVYDENTYTTGSGKYTDDDGVTHYVRGVYTGFKDASYSYSTNVSEYYKYGTSYNIRTKTTGANSPWSPYRNLIKKISFEDSYKDCKSSSYKYWFAYFKDRLTDIINWENLDLSEVTSMDDMFYNCNKLTSVDLSNKTANNLTSLKSTFENCEALTTLNLSGFVAGGLTNIDLIFRNCKKVTELDVSGFNTDNVTTLNSSFSGCSALESIEGLENWNVSNVTQMQSTFALCSSLTDLEPLEDWTVTSALTDLTLTFIGCNKVTSLEPIKDWDVSNVTTMRGTFWSCSSIEDLEPLASWTVENGVLTDLSSTFYSCNKVPSLEPIGSWNVSNVTTMASTFYECSSIEDLEPLENWTVTSALTDLSNTFYSCNKVPSLEPIRSWNVSNVTTMQGTFYRCFSIEDLEPLENWTVTSALTDLSKTFYSCNKVPSLEPIKDWDVSNVTTMASTFCGCSSIEDLEPLENWTVENGALTVLSFTFGNCNKVPSLEPIKDWDVSNVVNLNHTFSGCSFIASLEPLKEWNVQNVTTLQSTFSDCSALTSMEGIKNWNTSSVTNMQSTFYNCISLESLDLSKWNTKKVTSFNYRLSNSNYTFIENCSALKYIKFGKDFSTLKVSNKTYDLMLGETHSWSKRLRYIDFYDCEETTAVPSNATYFNNMLGGAENTTVIYLPKGSNAQTDKQNVVYTDGETLKCPRYYSEDRTSDNSYYIEVELPHTFQTNRAEYSRTMAQASLYGTCILPYDFDTNDEIQCYVLTQEHPWYMYFVEAETVPAHTPFLFRKNNKNATSASFVMVDESGNFGITVHQTHDTSVPVPEDPEDIPEGMTAADYGPYISGYDISAQESWASSEVLEDNIHWETRGYYETVELEPNDKMFYVAQNKFWQAWDMQRETLQMNPHRATFHGSWRYDPESTSGEAPHFSIVIADSEGNEQPLTDIEKEQLNEVVLGYVIYDAQGRRQPQLQQGLNIIHYADGTVKKVFRK